MTELVRIFNDGVDWDAFWDLLQQSFPKRQRDETPLIDTEYYALKQDDKLVGTVIVDLEGPDWVCLYNVSVDSERRKSGHGREMLAQLAETLTGRFNYMLLYTEPHTLDFYSALGFKLDSLQPAELYQMHKKLD